MAGNLKAYGGMRGRVWAYQTGIFQKGRLDSGEVAVKTKRWIGVGDVQSSFSNTSNYHVGPSGRRGRQTVAIAISIRMYALHRRIEYP